MEIAPESPDTPDAQALLAAADAVSASLYPPESNHPACADLLGASGSLFLVARNEGAAVGCGAVLVDGPAAELKRLFVQDGARGRGVARAMLATLEAHAAASGVAVVRLETGIHSLAARSLYLAAGYVERGPFGGYRPDPLSVFMEKRL